MCAHKRQTVQCIKCSFALDNKRACKFYCVHCGQWHIWQWLRRIHRCWLHNTVKCYPAISTEYELLLNSVPLCVNGWCSNYSMPLSFSCSIRKIYLNEQWREEEKKSHTSMGTSEIIVECICIHTGQMWTNTTEVRKNQWKRSQLQMLINYTQLNNDNNNNNQVGVQSRVYHPTTIKDPTYTIDFNSSI